MFLPAEGDKGGLVGDSRIEKMAADGATREPESEDMMPTSGISKRQGSKILAERVRHRTPKNFKANNTVFIYTLLLSGSKRLSIGWIPKVSFKSTEK